MGMMHFQLCEAIKKRGGKNETTGKWITLNLVRFLQHAQICVGSHRNPPLLTCIKQKSAQSLAPVLCKH